MNRRELLKNGLLAGTLSMIPFSGVLAKTPEFPGTTEDDLSGYKKIIDLVSQFCIIFEIFLLVAWQ